MRTAGMFRDRVVIQTRTSGEATFGGPAGDWQNTATRWARRVKVSQSEAMVLAQRGHEERVERLVFRGELVVDIPDTRFVLSGRYYRAIEPPDVDLRERTSSVLVTQEAQR